MNYSLILRSYLATPIARIKNAIMKYLFIIILGID